MEELLDMEEEIDPYERQLLSVFKSCDSSESGILDRNGFNKLCNALQLEENHCRLLSKRLGIKSHCNIAFAEFRDALLSVLASLKSPTDEYDTKPATINKTGEEETPKFTFGGKKYGRRSRPNCTDQNSEKVDVVDDSKETDDVFVMETDYKKEKDEVNIQMSEEGDDYEIKIICKRLEVDEDNVITTTELISICNSLVIPKSVYDMIQENMNKLKAHNMENNLDAKNELTFGQLFKLIKTLGYLNSNPLDTEFLNRGSIISFNEDGISNIDINSAGCINYDTLVYMLENAGISDAGIFLNDLGISPQFDVNLSKLAVQLQEELINVQRCMDNTHTLLNSHLLLLQASVVISQAQIKWFRSCMEQIQCERDKIRNDLLVANERASLLAQEVDDNHARMENSVQQKLKLLEQKHVDQIKKLSYQWSIEREQLTNQNMKLEKQLEQLLFDETRLRSEVASLKQDYETLEKENRHLLDQLVNAENVKEELEREIQRLSLLKKKVLELESSNEQAISFLEKMNQLQSENIMLRDKNDELVVELENVTLKQMQNRSGCSKRRGNSPLEVEEHSDTDVTALLTHRMYPKVRKYNTEKDLSTGIDSPPRDVVLSSGLVTQCESGIEADVSTSCSSLDRISVDVSDKVIPELKSRVTFLESFIRKYQLKVPHYCNEIEELDKMTGFYERSTNDLEKQCETLQLRLDKVQKEILKLLSEKRACSEENCVLKTKISQLMKIMPSSSNSNFFDNSSPLSENSDNSWLNRSSSDDSETLKADSPILEDAEALKYVENGLRLSVEEQSSNDRSITPEKHSVLTQTTINTSCSSVFLAVSEDDGMNWKSMDDRKFSGSLGDDEAGSEVFQSSKDMEKFEQDFRKLEHENKALKEKCEELSGCLDMLRSEYEQCEDYWVSKLDEERRLSEEEQRISDEKFAEIQEKIQEYGEMYGTHSMSSQTSKLPPIDENEKLEKEVNDLQEEFRVYKEKMEIENREKQNEIERLVQIISVYESSGNLKHSDRAIEHSLESIESNKTYVLENPSLDLHEIPRLDETLQMKGNECDELKQRKKQLKKECTKLTRERDLLIEQLLKMKSEPRASYKSGPCNHAIQQHNAEVSKSSALLRLRHQEMKNRQLRNLILQHQKKFTQSMKEASEQHAHDLAKYKSALTSSQEMWQSLQDTVKKQNEQIVMSDVLVKDLYVENSQLMATIHQLEQQHLDCPSPVLL